MLRRWRQFGALWSGSGTTLKRTERGWRIFEITWGRIEGCVMPNGRQNRRQRRSFCRSKRLFHAKRTAKPAAVPFILPFKTAILGQTDGKTNGSAVHSAVQNGYFRPNRRRNQRQCRSFCRSYTKVRLKVRLLPDKQPGISMFWAILQVKSAAIAGQTAALFEVL